MFILKNEGATLNLKRSDLLKARAIQNQWLLPLERTKHQSPSSGPEPFSQLYQVPEPRPHQQTPCPQGGA